VRPIKIKHREKNYTLNKKEEKKRKRKKKRKKRKKKEKKPFNVNIKS